MVLDSELVAVLHVERVCMFCCEPERRHHSREQVIARASNYRVGVFKKGPERATGVREEARMAGSGPPYRLRRHQVITRCPPAPRDL